MGSYLVDRLVSRYEDYLIVVLDVLDARTGALLWRGSTEGRLRDLRTPEERTARVNEIVAAVIAQFPPGEEG